MWNYRRVTSRGTPIRHGAFQNRKAQEYNCTHCDPMRGHMQTEQIGQFLVKVSRSLSLNDVLVPRLQHMRLLEEKKPRLSHAAPQEAGLDAKGLTAALRDREAQIEDLHNSLSWRLTAPMRHHSVGHCRGSKDVPSDGPSP